MDSRGSDGASLARHLAPRVGRLSCTELQSLLLYECHNRQRTPTRREPPRLNIQPSTLKVGAFVCVGSCVVAAYRAILITVLGVDDEDKLQSQNSNSNTLALTSLGCA